MRGLWKYGCLVLLAGLVCLGEPVQADDPGAGPTARLNSVIDAEWESRTKEQPTFASYLGDRRYNDRWPDVSLEAITRRHRHRQQVLKQLAAIDRKVLAPDDQLNYDLFRREYSVSVESHKFRWFLCPLTARDGIQDASSTADVIRFERLEDYQQWIKRLQSFGTYMDQTIALMQAGLKERRVHDREVMVRVPGQIGRQIVDDPGKSLFYKPFRSFPDGVSEADRKRLQAEARLAISDVVVPAYRRLHKFFTEKYLPGCFPRAGVWQIPDGHDFYAFGVDASPRRI